MLLELLGHFRDITKYDDIACLCIYYVLYKLI